MSQYTHVLAAVDLTEEAQQVARRAAALAQASNAKLSLVHVVEPLTFAYGGDIPVDLSEIQQQLQQQATQQLQALGDSIQVDEANRHVLTGSAVTEIHDIAEELGADLVVVGSHGRKGLALLLGSTANGVLHGARCDVLAVRVAD
ncbi:universal stress protein [Pseudomaricurvus sp. HS19]|uniref:universal stress protein n=1 Tax=Pseudomaricurvus sp. HS19 TaxID=2692626 RepID=UPI001368F3E2|nr:universal stress protein [Pseudomaricurvus sp. HS19]MYM62120.1 universal stress protein [Pseudomaricurvus sp. HS19]